MGEKSGGGHQRGAMAKKYRIRLSPEKREHLQSIVKADKAASRWNRGACPPPPRKAAQPLSTRWCSSLQPPA